jgi:hypothetical protein
MPYIASMGIYVFKKDVMEKLLQNDFPMANDFGGEVIPGAKDKGYHVQAYLFDGYWEDIGTVESFYSANLNLAVANPNFSFYDKASPIYTQSRFLPPSKLVDCTINTSIIGDGCSIRKASITGSVIGLRSIIHSDCKIEDALLMGADFFESYSECSALPGCTPIGIGAGTHIKRAIIDKNARIGMDCKITNAANVQEANKEDEWYIIKDGIVVVMKDAIIKQVGYQTRSGQCNPEPDVSRFLHPSFPGHRHLERLQRNAVRVLRKTSAPGRVEQRAETHSTNTACVVYASALHHHTLIRCLTSPAAPAPHRPGCPRAARCAAACRPPPLAVRLGQQPTLPRAPHAQRVPPQSPRAPPHPSPAQLVSACRAQKHSCIVPSQGCAGTAGASGSSRPRAWRGAKTRSSRCRRWSRE